MNAVNYYSIPGLKREKKEQFAKTADNIINLVCLKSAISWEKVISYNRKLEIVKTRHLVIYLLYRFAGLNKVEIARKMNRDHTTIIYSIKAMQDIIDTDDLMKSFVNELTKIIES